MVSLGGHHSEAGGGSRKIRQSPRGALALTVSILIPVACGVVLLGGCQEEQLTEPAVRPVRTVTVERRAVGVPVVLTGHIRARDEASLGFRLDGKVIERTVKAGDRVRAGQVIAKIDPQNQENVWRSAQADLASAQASLSQARANEARQKSLIERGFTTRVQFEAAQQQLEAAQALVDSARARLQTATDQVSYTELSSGVDGIVTAVGAETGEVVRAGQMVVRVAVENERDAVFDVPAQLIRAAPRDPVVEIWLADDPTIQTAGKVREVAPQADPTTRTYPVKVAIIDPPQGMRLGATVTGRVKLDSEQVIVVPGTALNNTGGAPAVWVVEPQSQTVSLRPVEVLRYDADSVYLSQGLQDGEIVVTAGVHALRPGQKVRLLSASS